MNQPVRRLQSKEIKSTRLRLIEEQNRICPLCQTQILDSDIIHLDHDHQAGHIRAALHGACNLGLGKVERAARMTRSPKQFIANLQAYLELHATSQHGLIHPNKLTPEERLNKMKRKARRKRNK